MDCGKFKEYLDNFENLTDEQKLEMNKHAADCEECADELDFMMSIIETTKSLPKIAVPPDFAAKLNARIDVEERKNMTLLRRAALNIKQNRNRYAAVAACFALVAVLTANGTNLIDKMNGSDDGGVIIDETVVTNAGDSVPLPSAVSIPALEVRKEDNNQIDTVPAPSVQSVKTAAKTNGKSKAVSTAVPKVSASVTSAPYESALAATAEPTVSVSEPVVDNGESVGLNNEEVQSIRGVYTLPTDNPASEPVAQSENVPGNYSLARSGDIAHGRYYRLDKDGNPIEDETPKAVGSIIISSDDADKAMDVILQYSYADGDFYMTDSDHLYLMLIELTQMGVDYSNYTPGYQGDITFKLVIS